MQKIRTFLWFDNKAEEAAQFYTSIFKNSSILEVHRYGEGAPMPAGTAMMVKFQLEGQEYMALNGGPHYSFTPAISLFVRCENQQEIDDLWSRLTEGGEEVQCGWLRDKYGLSWQIVPDVLSDLLNGEDEERSSNAMKAMLGMKKLDIAALQRAYDQPLEPVGR